MKAATIAVNGDPYCTMITDFFILALHGICVNNVWLQQDSATYHTYHATSVKRLVAVKQDEMVILIVRQETAIPHRLTISCGVRLKISVMPTNHRQLNI